MLFFIRFFCSLKYKFSLGKYLFPLFYFACIQFMSLFFSVQGTAQNTYYSNGSDEINCFSFRRICIPSKILFFVG